MRLLVSVRNEAEALLAAQGGVDFIDIKEPRDGALGGLPVPAIRAIVRRLREAGCGLPISATIGDWAMHEMDRIAACVAAVGDCEVDYVKVGIEPGPLARSVIDRLGASPFAIVPVFIADGGLDFDLVTHACGLGFPAVMADTVDKQAGSLFDRVSANDLRRFIDTVRRSDKLVGLAGALRLEHLQALIRLSPDFAGFRSAVCAGDRGSALDAGRLRELAECLPTCDRLVGASPSQHLHLSEQ